MDVDVVHDDTPVERARGAGGTRRFNEILDERRLTLQRLQARSVPEPDPLEANRLAVRTNLQIALEMSLGRWGGAWLCLTILLFLGFMNVLFWAMYVFDQHENEECEKRLAMVLDLLIILMVVGCFHNECVRCICRAPREDPMAAGETQDEPDPPRVKRCRWVIVGTILAWPIGCLIFTFISRAQGCSQALTQALLVVSFYFIFMVFMAAIVPSCFITAMLCMIRRGMVRMPRGRDDSPNEGLVVDLPKVRYDRRLFSDNGGCYPTQCPICLDDFDRGRQISKTFCEPHAHVFHTDCLEGWVQAARTCPLCRTSLLGPGQELSVFVEDRPSPRQLVDPAFRPSQRQPLDPLP